MDRSIKRVIKSIFPKVYFQTIRNCHTGYATVHGLVILIYINATTNGMLENEDIQDIYVELNTPINRETHFKDFISQIKDNQDAMAS